jgi:NAD(P)-dependent dehydrogenase (short-subunit alcohol dehydrogenase family)
MIDVREEALEAALKDVSNAGDAVAVTGDVSRPEAASSVVQRVLEAVDSVEILCNNVGLGSHTAPEDLTFEAWSELLQVNLTSTFLMAQGFGRHMIDCGIRGSIINTSSTCGASAMGRGAFGYSVAKAGVNHLTRELALEWGHFGIRVNAIEPCQVDTPGVRELMARPHPGGGSIGDRILSGIPLGRLATAEDLVGPVVFLASDAASMVSGTCLPVDGGNLVCNVVSSIRTPSATV